MNDSNKTENLTNSNINININKIPNNENNYPIAKKKKKTMKNLMEISHQKLHLSI